MASRQELVDYITEQMSGAGEVRSRKMFGEYAGYCDEKVVAFICDDRLLMKLTPASLEILPDASHEDAYPGSKPYIRVSEDLFDDREFMMSFARKTADSLPAPRPKKR